jgi:hypothetical protein
MVAQHTHQIHRSFLRSSQINLFLLEVKEFFKVHFAFVECSVRPFVYLEW